VSIFDRAAIAPGVYPFTPSTYDDAFSDRYRTLATTISSTRAEAIPAVYACTTVITEDIAKVPLHIYEDLGETPEGRSLGKHRASDHEWYDTLHHQASDEQDAIGFREMMTGFALNRGRAVAKKQKRRVGGTLRRELLPLHPDLVAPDRTENGEPRWRYDNPVTRRQEVLLPDEVFVLWGRRRKSVISQMREAFAIQLAMMEFAGQTWQRGPRHTGVISRPKDAPKWGDKARENFRNAIDEYMGEGERAGRPLLLEDGMTWVNSGFSLQDAQFLGFSQASKADVCAAYRVPQHKIQELMRSTNNNIEQQSVDYVVDSLLGWAVRWEQAYRMQLLADPFVAEHNLNGLLRGDFKTRAEGNAIYVGLGIRTRNEVREDEGWNPIEGADEPLVPLNMDVPGTSVAFAPPNGQMRAQLRAVLRHQAARVVRKEIQVLGKLADRTGRQGDDWEREVRTFFREHADFVAKELRIDDERASAYTAARCQAVLAGRASLEDPEESAIGGLTLFALNENPAEGVAA
jgi:HK97 family phage portal protein